MEMRDRGFTVIEIMTVIGILGIIMGIAIPIFRDYIPRIRLRTAGDEVLATLRLARTRALSERQICRVIFEKATNSYRIDPEGQSIRLPQGISIVNSFDIIYEFRPDRTAEIIPNQEVRFTNERNKGVTFHLIPATGYVRVEECQ